MGIQHIAKKILLEEIKENGHPEKVEDVIFWALKFYADTYPVGTLGRATASAIVARIKDAESEYQTSNN